jgi:hypothetical protein
MLSVIVMVAVGIRLAYELVEPVVPYLLAAVIVVALIRLSHWYHGRW